MTERWLEVKTSPLSLHFEPQQRDRIAAFDIPVEPIEERDEEFLAVVMEDHRQLQRRCSAEFARRCLVATGVKYCPAKVSVLGMGTRSEVSPETLSLTKVTCNEVDDCGLQDSSGGDSGDHEPRIQPPLAPYLSAAAEVEHAEEVIPQVAIRMV